MCQKLVKSDPSIDLIHFLDRKFRGSGIKVFHCTNHDARGNPLHAVYGEISKKKLKILYINSICEFHVYECN